MCQMCIRSQVFAIRARATARAVLAACTDQTSADLNCGRGRPSDNSSLRSEICQRASCLRSEICLRSDMSPIRICLRSDICLSLRYLSPISVSDPILYQLYLSPIPDPKSVSDLSLKSEICQLSLIPDLSETDQDLGSET